MWKYVKAILTHRYHVSVAVLAVGFAVINASDIVFLLWLLVDGSVVFFLATNERVQRLVDAAGYRDAADADAGPAEAERILAGLSAKLGVEYRERFDRMRAMHGAILKHVAGRRRTCATPLGITLAKIHELLLMYFRLAGYHANLCRLERPPTIEARIEARRRALDAEADPRVFAAIEASVETLEQELAIARQNQSEMKACAIRLETMEEQMRVITSMTLTSDDVDAFDTKVDEIWTCLRGELGAQESLAALATLEDLTADPVGVRLTEKN